MSEKRQMERMACGHERIYWLHSTDCGYFMPGFGECDSIHCHCTECLKATRAGISPTNSPEVRRARGAM